MCPLRRILSISEDDLQTIDILYRAERLRHYLFHRQFAIDLDQPPDAILARIQGLVDRYGATGHVDHALLQQQNIP